MEKTVAFIKAITDFVKTFLEGFGVFEFLVVVLLVFGFFAWHNPEGLAALGQALADFMPMIPTGGAG